MKLKFHLFLSLIFISVFFANAQKPIPFKSEFTYFQPPSNFLSESGTFSVSASLVYEEEVTEQLKDYALEMVDWKLLPAKEKLKRRTKQRGETHRLVSRRLLLQRHLRHIAKRNSPREIS